MYEHHKQLTGNNETITSTTKGAKKYILIGGVGILLFVGWLRTPDATPYKRAGANLVSRIAYASGLEQYSGIGNGERIIDFSIEIAGFTAGRAGVISSREQAPQSGVVFGTSKISARQNSGNQKQDNKWKLSDATARAAIAEPVKLKHPIHKGSEEQQKYIDYAWGISHDEDFVYLLKSENGQVSVDRKSLSVGSNGYYDYGLCQINKGYHPEIVNDKRFFTDYKWQLDQCYRLYKNGTTFYGIKRFKNDKVFQKKVKSAFNWIT